MTKERPREPEQVMIGKGRKGQNDQVLINELMNHRRLQAAINQSSHTSASHYQFTIECMTRLKFFGKQKYEKP